MVPAYEVRGEGIFIEFNQEDIDNWIESIQQSMRGPRGLTITTWNRLSGKKSSAYDNIRKFLYATHTISLAYFSTEF